MKYETFKVGLLATNCYIVWDETTHQALIIDPGDNPAGIIQRVESLQLVPQGILLTHAHVDHIHAVSDIAVRFGIGVWCHENDRALYGNPQNAILPWFPAAEDLPDLDETPATIDNAPYTILHTPGHTPGGVCYYFADKHVVFSGDTLFQGTYGRTDFPGGSRKALFASIREKLLPLPPETVVCPGHGEPTTIGEERRAQSFDE